MNRIRTLVTQHRKLVIIYSVFVVLLVIAAVLSPTFRSLENIGNLLNRATPLLLVALGQTIVVLLSGFDLSVGPVASLATVIAAVVMRPDPTFILLGLLLVFGAGGAFGFVNGWIISKLNLHPLIATLSTLAIAQGVALHILSQPGGIIPSSFLTVVSYRVGPFSVSFLLFVGVAVLLYFILHHRTFGRHLYAVGGDEENARVSGLNVDRIKIKAYTLTGLLAALGGLMLGVRIGSGDPTVGAPLILESLTAVLMGGTTFAGGRGGIGGTIVGVLILLLLKNIFNFLEVHAYWQHVLRGLILVTAVLAYNVRLPQMTE